MPGGGGPYRVFGDIDAINTMAGVLLQQRIGQRLGVIAFATTDVTQLQRLVSSQAVADGLIQ